MFVSKLQNKGSLPEICFINISVQFLLRFLLPEFLYSLSALPDLVFETSTAIIGNNYQELVANKTSFCLWSVNWLSLIGICNFFSGNKAKVLQHCFFQSFQKGKLSFFLNNLSKLKVIQRTTLNNSSEKKMRFEDSSKNYNSHFRQKLWSWIMWDGW